MSGKHNRSTSQQNTKTEVIFPRLEEQNEIIYPRIDDLQGSEKPEVPTWLLENIAELSKHARTVHAVYVGFLLYCALTILTTPDRKIILDEQAHLPIINLDVPFSGFVVAAPIAAIIIFIDFQIHLQVLKGAINRAKTSYSALGTGRLFPWMMNLVEEPETGLLGRVQRFMVNLSTWCLMPLVLILTTAFTFKKHNTALAILEWLVACVGISLALWLWHRYDNSPTELSGNAEKGAKYEQWINRLILNWGKVFFAAMIIFIQLVLLLMIREENRVKTGWFRVDLSNQSLIKEQREDLGGYWINLQGVHLDGANLYGADLRKADLRQAKLQQSNLQLTSLTGANLSSANIEGGILFEAKLQQVSLSGANLSQANLNCANLKKADFLGANLSGAFLLGADLSEAQNLLPEQLLKAATLYQAKLDQKLKDYIFQNRPDLLNEPNSEELVMKRFPSTIAMEYKRYEEQPFTNSPDKNILEDSTELILVKAGSGSIHCLKERGVPL